VGLGDAVAIMREVVAGVERLAAAVGRWPHAAASLSRPTGIRARSRRSWEAPRKAPAGPMPVGFGAMNSTAKRRDARIRRHPAGAGSLSVRTPNGVVGCGWRSPDLGGMERQATRPAPSRTPADPGASAASRGQSEWIDCSLWRTVTPRSPGSGPSNFRHPLREEGTGDGVGPPHCFRRVPAITVTLRADAPGPASRRPRGEALQSEDGGGLCRVGPPLRPISRDTAPVGAHRPGRRDVPELAGPGGEGERRHPDAGGQRPGVPSSRRPRPAAGPIRGAGARQAASSGAGRPHPRRGGGRARPTGEHTAAGV
jgi:hypothetical protein